MNVENQYHDQEIHKASLVGDLEKIKSLVNRDFNVVYQKGWFGKTPLHYAAQSGSLESVKYFIDLGVDVNIQCIENRSTPIFFASNVDIARFLVECGAKINWITTKGRTPLDYAIQDNKIEIVKFFIQSGADPELGIELDDTSIIDWALLNIKDKSVNLEIIEILLNSGVNPNSRDGYGRTVLYTASTKNQFEIVELLLKFGADPCIRDESGFSCFEIVKDQKILELIQPFKINLLEKKKIKKSFDELVETLIEIKEVLPEQLIPCSEEEILELEALHKINFPKEYRKFLKIMGKGAGGLFESNNIDIYYSALKSILGIYFHNYINEDCEENTVINLPGNFFVFATRYGESTYGLYLDENVENPEIYLMDEFGEIIKSNDCFLDFLQEHIDSAVFYHKLGKRRKVREIEILNALKKQELRTD